MGKTSILTGRLGRLTSLAGLGPRAGLAIVRDRLTGGDGDGVGAILGDTLGSLKGGSLKLGQILAQVADDLPAAARARLGRLYAEVPAMPEEVVRAALAAEGIPPFATFEAPPFAAASLGQVHRATLTDGTIVAVKVQYPDVDVALRADLDNLRAVAGTIAAGGALFDAAGYFTALRADTLAELDYRAEADRLDEMRAAVASWPDLVVPKVYRELSTGRVLTLDLLAGPTLHGWCDGDHAPEHRQILADQVVRAVLGPLRSGLVNADAHPGNFVVLADERLGLLDFGAVRAYGRWPAFSRLLEVLSAPELDNPGFLDALRSAGFTIDLPDHRALRFAAAIAEILRPMFSGPHDFGVTSMTAALGKLKQRRPLDTLHFRPSPDAIALLRALLGLHHALRRLGGPLDLRAAIRAVG